MGCYEMLHVTKKKHTQHSLKENDFPFIERMYAIEENKRGLLTIKLSKNWKVYKH